MNIHLRKYMLIILMTGLSFIGASAQTSLVLPAVFSDNMVLQQKTNAAIWGKSKPGRTVKVTNTWGNQTYTTTADSKGNWKVNMATPAFGGPYRIDISDGTRLSLYNVLIGEVWICSGQSNMEMPLAGWGMIKDHEKEIAEANYPNIRLLNVAHVASNQPLTNAALSNVSWQPCSPQNIPLFSSVAYFFARELYAKTGIPIGLIHTSWGGTIAEAWTSGTTLKQLPDFAAAVKKIEATDQAQAALKYKKELTLWESGTFEKDSGFTAGKPVWAAKDFESFSWERMNLPAFWEEKALPDFDGVVWFRKRIDLSDGLAGKDLTLNLGTIDDNDITYFDGEKVGETSLYSAVRKYVIPARMTTPGTHVITVRVLDTFGGGGIYGEKNILSLRSADGNMIALDGDWAYKVGLNLKALGPLPAASDGPNRPSVLYNAMINPFIQYGIRGAIWYQGESNADRADQYSTLFPAMITDWRKKWGRGDFPFYFVQLANFKDRVTQPGDAQWAELRDAQKSTLSLPNTGMAVTIDIGDAKDIHPKNKQEVGRRLALIALAKVYGKPVVASGPVMNLFHVEGKVIKVGFSNTDGGLKTEGEKTLTGFSIAGADQQFHWATARISGDEVVVSSEEVPEPVAVRYGWSDNPACNLYNGAGLPAGPFRTDRWPYSTAGRK